MTLKIGMIGLDTSHVEIFTSLLHNQSNQYKQAKVVLGCPSPSKQVALSRERVDQYTTSAKDTYHVKITESITELAEHTDAIMITAVDGQKHLELFKQVAAYQKPVFIDKPFATTLQEAYEIFAISEHYNTPIMSSSSLRYAESLQNELTRIEKSEQKPTGIYVNGPLPFIKEMPYYFWYGIHMIEMLVTVLGPHYQNVHVHGNDQNDVITTEWEDGRFGIIRGDRKWHGKFEAVLHYEENSIHLPIYKDKTPYYACLLKEIISFFITGKNPIPKEETLGIIKIIEDANQKRKIIELT
ncbi:Gfo/Idh/MocA family oxidoreductase [Oceanobacillus halotolerans]|uniref:Gfo/Idh/MocA family oxidoreductase n=1 Tax=Oceanobacillus halotolerans TaxID=2663380 RepID=UPI0013DBFAEC|nr:Gfo/Idh/MocA family oxidoreductase [Oceanobacillus halotolerans]